MNSQQLGNFILKEDLIRNHPGDVAKAFRDMEFVAVHTEMDFIGNIHYRGISSKFRAIPKGMMMPEYSVEIIKESDGGEPEYAYVIVEPLSPITKSSSDEVSGD